MIKKVKDIPPDERPREKLAKKGPQELSDVELIAILIGRGIEGHDVMSVANQVLNAIDSNGGTPDCAALQNIAGMGPAKATLIAAALEFARRRIKTHVHPREVFADAITDRASAIIVAHNHTSGHVEPGKEDMEITKQLQSAEEILGIKLLDHIIFNKTAYYSFLEKNEI